MGKVVLVVVALALTIYCLFDIGATPRGKVRVLPKAVWLLVVLIPIVGPGWWLWTSYGAPHAPARSARRVVAPDDDSDFLTAIDRAEQKSLNAWEDELRRRERDPGQDA